MTGEKHKSELLDAIQKGLLAGAAVAALLIPPASIGARMPQQAARTGEPLAPDFGVSTPTDDVRTLAAWTLAAGDARGKSFIIVDKKDARVWVFAPDGRLKADAPALVGSAIGDDSVPGIGDKPIPEVLPEERTTPAGRFVAEMGMDTRNEDVVWVSYELAVSMHRVLTSNPTEHRLERLATPTPADNRISWGCINLPKEFYEQVVAPTVRTTGAIIYVLPETRPMQQVFNMHGADTPVQMAQQAGQRAPRAGRGNE